MTPQIREETAKTAVFRQRWQAWKVVRSIAAVRQRPRTPRNWRCSFAFFESFLWHFNKKRHAEVIFRLSRPVLCKNQENGSGKQWSLHAPLNNSQRWVASGRFYPGTGWVHGLLRTYGICCDEMYWQHTNFDLKGIALGENFWESTHRHQQLSSSKSTRSPATYCLSNGVSVWVAPAFIKSNGRKRTKTNQYIATFLCFQN